MVDEIQGKISFSADTSPIERLIKSLQRFEKISADISNAVPEVTEALSQFINVSNSASGSLGKTAKAAKDLSDSLGDSSAIQKSSKNLQGYLKTVNDLRAALGKDPVKADFFPDTSSAAFEIKSLEKELLNLVNVYRSSFGRENLLDRNFTTDGAISELAELRAELLKIVDASGKDLAIDFNFKEGNQDLQNFKSTLERVNAVGIRPSNSEVALSNFKELRIEGNDLVTEIQKIQSEMQAIGPAAARGGAEAVKKFDELSRGLSEAQSRAGDLGKELNRATEQFARQTANINVELGAFGFRQITLDDIFPSEEQAKVAQLNERINAQVVSSITQGAVRDSINSFLRTAEQTQLLNRRAQRSGRGGLLDNVQLEGVSEESLQNIVRLTSHLPRLRYALYDTSNTVAIFGGALLGLSVGAIKVAADFERAFADVERVTDFDPDGGGLQNLRNQLIDLSKDIPASFEDIAGIATLAGQLNVAENSIANFTETVAKFAATTDVTIEASATAFGRLDQLVDGVDGQFDKLGSAILAVGVNSVATESEIIAIANQIASIANIAGFSAAELIGFSSALASVGTRPELSRGTFTRLFSEINEAVTLSTTNLDRFARLAGQSSEEFIDAWTAGRGASQIVEILRGLSTEGANAELSLRALGITSVRDIPTLLKLAQSVEEVEKQLAIATVGFLAGTELNEQYSVIAATLSEKLVVLKNNFQALVATVAGLTGPLTFAIDLLISLIGATESLLRNPVAQIFLGGVGAITLFVGALSLVVSGIIRFGASVAGMLTSMIELRTATAITQVSVAGLNTTINSTTVAAGAATGAMGRLTAATGIMGGAAGVAAGATGIAGINTAIRAFMGVGGSATGVTNKLGGSLLGLFKNSRLAASVRLVAPFLGWTGVALGVIGVIDAVGRSFGAWGNQVESTIDDIGPYLEAAKQDTQDWAESTDQVKEEFLTFIPALSSAEGEIDNYVKMIMIANGEEALLASLINQTTGELEGQTIAIGKNTQALIRQDVVKKMMADAEAVGFLPGQGGFGVGVDDLRMNEALAALQEVVTDPALNEGLKSLGFDFAEMVRLISSGSTEAANAMGVTLAAAAAEMADALESVDPEGHAEDIDQLRKIAQFGAPALQRYNSVFEETVESLKATTFEAFLAGEGMTSLEEEVSEASDAMSIFREKFATAFGDVDAIKDINDALIGLDSAIQENGNSFDNLSARGNANLIALQLAVFATVENAKALGLDAAGAIALVFDQLVRSGVDVATAFTLASNAAGSIGITVTGVEQLTSLLSGLTGTYGAVGGAARSAGGAVKTFADQARELTSSLFENVNATRSTEDAIFALGEAFGEGGKEALYAGEEMQGAIDAILSSSGNGEQAVANLASLFIKLSNTVGSQTDPSLAALRQTINAVAQQFGITTAQVEQFIKTAGGDLANINLDNFNRGIQNAQKEVRTLLDYASDLEQVFSRAFDIRFARTFALDDIADSFDSLSQSVEDARFELEELQESQSNLGADRGLKEYFLSIAEAYGDTLRAAQLRKEIAELDREQAENTRRLEEAQAIAGGDLTGQGPGQRQNRQALLGLVQNYQDYITALAESGATQAELTAATEEARREFIQQATELGFQESVVLEYAAAFDDVQTAISSVERNITVEANVNPALQALNELNASLNKNIEAARELNNQLRAPVPTRSITPTTQQPAFTQPGFRPTPLLPPRAPTIGDIIFNRPTVIFPQVPTGSSSFYSEGGFTGRGGKYEPAGIVHRGEYVVPKQFVNQSTGLPDAGFLAQLQNGVRSFAVGGFAGTESPTSSGPMMVELSPFDRKLLADAGNVQLRLNGKVVAEATNQNNFDEARRGSN